MSRRSNEDDAEAFPWLKFWLRLTKATSSANSKKIGVARLSQQAWLMLVFLATKQDQMASVTDIREECEISEASATRHLNALEAVGYITRGQANDDARWHEVRLAKEGRSALGKVYHAARSAP